MSEPRRHGTWSKVFDGIDDHAKTRAAARALAIETGISEDYAAAVVVRAVGRLVRWAIRESDYGKTGHLSDHAIASIGWPAGVAPGGPMWGREDAGALRRALLAVPEGHQRGFLFLWGARQGRPGVEHLHEFQFYAWDALKGRSHYRGTALADFDLCPYGKATSAAPLARSATSTPAAAAFPVEHPRRILGPPAASAPPPGVGSIGSLLPGLVMPEEGGDRSPGRSSSEVAPRLGGKCEPKSSAAMENASRKSRDFPVHLSIRQQQSRSEQICPEGTPPAIPRLSEGWAGVPTGVRAGEAEAVAGWIRELESMSHAKLYPGSTYVARWAEHAGLVPPGAATDPTARPGRVLEALDPDAFRALVADLVAHLPRKDYPRKYTARAIAARWEDALGKLADAAAKRRSQWRERGKA